jgi:hypothetical protein
VFLNLPLETFDRKSLQRQMDDIGGGTGSA